MAVKINFNEAAAQTHTSLVRNERAMNKSLLRMSTGVRILNASDDSAGMFIADMLSTIAKAYEQGNRNIQTGFSAMQIAEASAGQIYDKLQEIYVRAQNAANDINDPNARQALQREITNFVDAIQKIGTDTEYNGIKLLDGTFTGKYIHYGPRMDQTVNINITDLRAQSLGAYLASGNGATGTGVSSTAGGTLSNLLGSNGSLGNLGNFILNGTSEYVRIADTTVYQGVSGTSYLVDAATLAKNINENDTMKSLQIEARATNISRAAEYNNVITGTYSYTGSATDSSGSFNATIDLNFYIGDGTKTFTVNLGNVSGAGSDTNNVTNVSITSNIVDLDTLVNRINTAARAVGANVTALNDNGRLNLVTKNGETIAIETRINYDETEANGGTISANLNVDLGQLLQGANTVSNISFTADANRYAAAVKVGQIEIGGIDSFRIEYSGVSAQDEGLYFQINSGSQASIQSLYDINVTTNNGAEKALMIVSKALQKTDSVRAQIGATMNNLQSIFDSQKVAYDNTKEAESVIRNTDYAKEMADFTTYQIRMQSTIAMLAQANTLPQLVLQLMR